MTNEKCQMIYDQWFSSVCQALNHPRRKSLTAPAPEQPRVEQTYSHQASCPSAIFESALCAESDCPACGRKRLQPPTPDAVAPTTNLYRDSSGSVHPESVARFQTPGWPIFSRGVLRAHPRGMVQGIPPAHDASYQ